MKLHVYIVCVYTHVYTNMYLIFIHTYTNTHSKSCLILILTVTLPGRAIFLILKTGKLSLERLCYLLWVIQVERRRAGVGDQWLRIWNHYPPSLSHRNN